MMLKDDPNTRLTGSYTTNPGKLGILRSQLRLLTFVASEFVIVLVEGRPPDPSQRVNNWSNLPRSIIIRPS